MNFLSKSALKNSCRNRKPATESIMKMNEEYVRSYFSDITNMRVVTSIITALEMELSLLDGAQKHQYQLVPDTHIGVCMVCHASHFTGFRLNNSDNCACFKLCQHHIDLFNIVFTVVIRCLKSRRLHHVESI